MLESEERDMSILLKGGKVLRDGAFSKADLLISDGKVVDTAPSKAMADATVFDIDGKYVFPGFADVHVHLREPGFSYKETIASGTAAAARGGYTAVCAMPNLDPVPDSAENLEKELERIRQGALVRVYPYGAITKGEKGGALSDMDALAPFTAGFSDDGKGVQSEEMMLRAMKKAAALGKIISAHCEDERYPAGESEWREAERDIALAEKTGCKLHICHVSKKQTVELVRKAKARGIDVTCETAPHYLLLTENDVRDDGRFKMNPPLGTESDRRALIEGICDGTVDMIATDHAPHSSEEKARGFKGSLSGIVGLECAFPMLYTELVEKNIITLSRLLELMAINPARRFGIGNRNGIETGAAADLTVFELESEYEIRPEEFKTMGRSTPFSGRMVKGRCVMTFCGGKQVWSEEA